MNVSSWTNVEEYKYEHKWSIKNFQRRLKWWREGRELSLSPMFNSVTFSTGSRNVYEWHLKMDFRSGGYGGAIRFKLICDNYKEPNRKELRLRYDFFIINCQHQKVSLLPKRKRDRLFGPPSEEWTEYDFEGSEILNNVETYLENDKLSIVCEMHVRAECFEMEGIVD